MGAGPIEAGCRQGPAYTPSPPARSSAPGRRTTDLGLTSSDSCRRTATHEPPSLLEAIAQELKKKTGGGTGAELLEAARRILTDAFCCVDGPSLQGASVGERDTGAVQRGLREVHAS